MAKTATKPSAKPDANVTPSDVPLMPWESAGTSKEVDENSLLAAVESSEDDPDESEPEAEESAEPDEVEEELDESEESEEEDSDEQEDAEPDVIDLGDEKVTREELKKRGLREADYTRKTQELAAKRKEVEAAESAAREKLALYEQRLEVALKATEVPEPEWDKLREELDPAEFAQAFADYNLRAEQRRKVEAELERVRKEQLEGQQKAIQAWAESEKEKLLEAVPEWRDEAKSRDEKQAVIDYMKQNFGASDAEIANLYHHGIWVAMRKAMLYDRMQTNGKERLREKVKHAPVLKPGAAAPKQAKGKTAIVHARNKLARSGSVQDAAALIAQFLDD